MYGIHPYGYALHPPPINRDLARIRQNYLCEVGRRIAAESTVLVVGDLNSSPFSPVFRDFLSMTGTKMRTGNDWPTWRPLGLHIDHVLSRGGAPDAVQVQALPWQYSDHRALWVSWHGMRKRFGVFVQSVLQHLKIPKAA